MVDEQTKKLLDNVLKEDDILNENITSTLLPYLQTNVIVVREGKADTCGRRCRDTRAQAPETGYGGYIHPRTATLHSRLHNGGL